MSPLTDPPAALARLVAAVEDIQKELDAILQIAQDRGSEDAWQRRVWRGDWARFAVLQRQIKDTLAQAALGAGEPVTATHADRLSDATLREYAPNDNVIGWMATDLLAARAALAQAEQRTQEWSGEAERQRQRATKAERERFDWQVQAESMRNQLDALRSNVADLTASLKVAQESLRQREAAQRAAEERLETQIQAAFVAQEAQIAQGWKLHEAEEQIAALRAEWDAARG